MKTTFRVATALVISAIAATASAQNSNITTFVVPYQVTNTTGAPMRIIVECGLFIGRRLVSTGGNSLVVPPGSTSGTASVGMHWPTRENPSRINQFACQVTQSADGPDITVPEAGGIFSLPHAGLRSYVSGAWPR